MADRWRRPRLAGHLLEIRGLQAEASAEAEHAVSKLLALVVLEEFVSEALLEGSKLAKPGDFLALWAYSWSASHWSSASFGSGPGTVWRLLRGFSFPLRLYHIIGISLLLESMSYL
jgi:hypothetical protein